MRHILCGNVALLVAACSNAAPAPATSSSNLDGNDGFAVVRENAGFYAVRELADKSVIAAYTYGLQVGPSALMKLHAGPQSGDGVVDWNVGLGSGASALWTPDADHFVVGLVGNQALTSNPHGIASLERRLVADGSLDTAFATGGTLAIPSGVATELAPDGSLVVLVARDWQSTSPPAPYVPQRLGPSQLGALRVDLATGASASTDFPPLPAWSSEGGQFTAVHAEADGSVLAVFDDVQTSVVVKNGFSYENIAREIGVFVLRQGQPPVRTTLGFGDTRAAFVTSNANADGSLDLVYSGNVGDLAPTVQASLVRIHVNADGTKGALTTIGDLGGPSPFPFNAYVPLAFQNGDLVRLGHGTAPDGTFSTSLTRIAPDGSSTVKWSAPNDWALLFPQASGALYAVSTQSAGFGNIDVTLQRLP